MKKQPQVPRHRPGLKKRRTAKRVAPDELQPERAMTILDGLQQNAGNRAVQRLLESQKELNPTEREPGPGGPQPNGRRETRPGNAAIAPPLARQDADRLATPVNSIHLAPLTFTNASGIHVLRQGLLNAAQVTSAINFTNRRYDSRSVRIIQDITGTDVDGDFGANSAQAVADFQDTNPPLEVDGKVGENTLNVMVPERVGQGLQEHAIQLVADFYDLNVTRDTLTVHFDPALAAAFDTAFESGNLRVIRVGPGAFGSATDLRDAIRAGLAVAAPPAAVVGPRPTHLSTAEEQAASNFNRTRYTDRRSILAIQGLVGTNPDAQFGPDTAERIAEYQSTNGLEVDGKVGEETLRVMVADLDGRGEQNAAIRLIIDFFNLSEQGALLDIAFDSTVAANATTSGVIPGPSIVRIGPAAFAQGFAGLVHTIAHELEHVRQRRVGILSQPVREFLGESVEILSVGMPEEDDAGFFDDAGRALSFWNLMTPDEQSENFETFEAVRERVRARFNSLPPADQATHQATMDGYEAVVAPP